MIAHLLAGMICDMFDNICGRWQVKKPESERKAMITSFKTTIDHNRESGYRYLDLVIYGPTNYVCVFVRERWAVIPLQDLEYGDDWEDYIKKGKDYVCGDSGWERISYHDSGWKGAVTRTIQENETRLVAFDSDIKSCIKSLDELKLNFEALNCIYLDAHRSRDMETLAANIVESGNWLPYEVYLAWIKEQQQPGAEKPKVLSVPNENPTVRIHR